MKTLKTKSGAATQREVLQLMAPIVEFLRRSGATERDLTEGLAASLAKARRARKRFEVRRMGDYYTLSYITHYWRSHPDFTNAAGKPLYLPLAGKVSISALVQLAGLQQSPQQVVQLMMKLGNVKRTKAGTYSLLKRYTNFKVPSALPFEPNHQFLADAIAAATRGMGGVGGSKSLFWLNDHLKYIPSKHISAFLSFLHSRSTAYIEEVGEWLQQVALTSEQLSQHKRQTYRMGVGLFPICTKD